MGNHLWSRRLGFHFKICFKRIFPQEGTNLAKVQEIYEVLITNSKPLRIRISYYSPKVHIFRWLDIGVSRTAC